MAFFDGVLVCGVCGLWAASVCLLRDDLLENFEIVMYCNCWSFVKIEETYVLL